MINKYIKGLIALLFVVGFLWFFGTSDNAKASVSNYTASGFAQYCSQNNSTCKKTDENGRTGSASCPSNNQTIDNVYVHSGDGQTVYQLPDNGFSYSFSNNNNTVTVTSLPGSHDLSWIGVTCSTHATSTPTPTLSTAATPTPTSIFTPTPTPNCDDHDNRDWGWKKDHHDDCVTPTVTPTPTQTPNVTSTPTPTPTETVSPTPTNTPSSNIGGPGDGRSDGRSDGLSSCPSCTQAPQGQVLGASTGPAVLGLSTTSGEENYILQFTQLFGALTSTGLGFAFFKKNG